MAYIVTAYIVMAHIVMAVSPARIHLEEHRGTNNIRVITEMLLAIDYNVHDNDLHSYGPYSHGLYQVWPRTAHPSRAITNMP